MTIKFELVETLGKCKIYKDTYKPVFPGCQCHKDCNCKEEFYANRSPIEVVYKLNTGRRCHVFSTLEAARKAMIEIDSLQRNEVERLNKLKEKQKE